MQQNEFNLPPLIYAALVTGTEAFFQTTGKALAEAIKGPEPKPGEGPLGPSYPPAYDVATLTNNAEHGYGIEGIRGGRIVPDYQLVSRLKRLEAALVAGDRVGVPRDRMKVGFLLGDDPAFQDGKDIADPDDPNALTPPWKAPFPYLSNYAGQTAQSFIEWYWAQKAAPGGGLPSGPKG